MTLCLFVLVEEVGPQRYLHRCTRCDRPIHFPFSDANNCERECRVQVSPVGDHFFKIVQELDIHEREGCDCAALRAWMNTLGPEGCRARKAELLARIEKNAAFYGLADWTCAGWNAFWQGKPLTLEGLLEAAIRRAESMAGD